MIKLSSLKVSLLSLSVIMLSSCAALLDSYKKDDVDFSKYNKVSVVRLDSISNQSAGQEIADIVALEFMKKGYQVVERSQLKSIIDEEALRHTGLSADSKEKLKIAGIDAIITGSVANYDCAPSAVEYQGIKINQTTCSVTLALKMLDVNTGELVWAANGSHSDSGIQLNAQQVLKEIIKKLEKVIPVKGSKATISKETILNDIATEKTTAPVPVQTNNTGNVQASLSQASILLGQGKMQEAAEEYKKVLVTDTANGEAYSKLAYIYTNLGNQAIQAKQFSEAVRFYEDAVKYNPYDAAVFSNLGVAYFSQGNMDKAIESYQSAIKVNINYAQAHDNLGIAYHQKGDIQKAVEEYKKACQLGMQGTCDWLKNSGY